MKTFPLVFAGDKPEEDGQCLERVDDRKQGRECFNEECHRCTELEDDRDLRAQLPGGHELRPQRVVVRADKQIDR